MRVLITGGAGFIGSHLAEHLIARGDEVYALDDLSTGRVQNLANLKDNPNFHLIVDSVLHPAVVNELVHKVDVVYHLAAAVGVKTIVEQPVRTLRVNLGGTEVVLDACCKFQRPVLVASTSEVYGDHRSETPLHESSRRIYGATTQKRWAYADSKAMDEFLALAYHEEFELETVIVRLFNTVGPRQSGQYGMVIPRFVERALTDETIEIYGDGEQTRCFCHVADTVLALAALMDELPRTSGELFNIGAPNQISILDLADRIMDMTGSSSSIAHVPFREVYGTGIEDMLHRVPCIDKVHETIGWTPERTLEDILADVVESVSANLTSARVPA
ncbi:MAG TPA: GDP-mannose 4,6-dehydratase [Gaiellaceae bacterium]|jgi:UDP-glucose 4-epimerase|nr:GDP-mannose 4,6-dehydratase [Gaiellaceae bacterium]